MEQKKKQDFRKYNDRRLCLYIDAKVIERMRAVSNGLGVNLSHQAQEAIVKQLEWYEALLRLKNANA